MYSEHFAMWCAPVILKYLPALYDVLIHLLFRHLNLWDIAFQRWKNSLPFYTPVIDICTICYHIKKSNRFCAFSVCFIRLDGLGMWHIWETGKVRAGIWWGDGKRLLGRPRHRWEDIKMGIQKLRWGGVEWIGLAQDRDRWRALVNTVMNLRVP